MQKIVVRGLTKVFPTRYGAVAALQDLDLVIHEGEFFVLLGPSGCGKTTLLRIMAGLERQTSGEIAIARINRVSLRFDQDWYAQNGFVAQKVNLSLVVDDRFVLHALEKLGRYQ